MKDTPAAVTWVQDGSLRSAAWWSANERPQPKTVVTVDDRLTADQAMRYASQGTGMLWIGDYHNARQLLRAIDARSSQRIKVSKGVERAKRVGRAKGVELATRAKSETGTRNAAGIAEAGNTADADEFYRIRQARAQRSRLMSLVLIPLEFDTTGGEMVVPLPRAPRVGPAIKFAYSEAQQQVRSEQAVVSLQELIGVRSAHQWFVNGVEVPSLGAKIHPHYGTFMPTRQEYVDLVARAPLPSLDLAFDIGTGTGVLAAVLAKRGVRKVIGTDIHERAVDCANDNFTRLKIQDQASAQLTSMFADGRASLIVCNPPWLPGSAATALDAAVYDPGGNMLRQFLNGLPSHLTADGEGWLILSDLAELLGLRTRQMLLEAIEHAGLEIIDRLDTSPTHRRAHDTNDPLHAARSSEVTSLWRLRTRSETDR
jgi:methylase of polypeptide subunit release factors